MPSRKLGAPLFALVCLAMACYDQFAKPLDAKFIGLILLATVPWLAPWILPMIGSLKIGGLELKFRKEMEDTRQLAQAAAAAAMDGKHAAGGKKPIRKKMPAEDSSYKSLGVPIPGAEGIAAEADDDPNKGKFGGSREHDGLRLNAEVKPVVQSSDYFLLHVWVEATAGKQPLRDGVEVTFHLHPTFGETEVSVSAANGMAAIDRLAWGAFTIGAVVGDVRLELDLATEVPDAPAAFREA